MCYVNVAVTVVAEGLTESAVIDTSRRKHWKKKTIKFKINQLYFQGNQLSRLTLLVLEPDLHQTIVHASGCEQRAVRAEAHQVNGPGSATLPHAVPRARLVTLSAVHVSWSILRAWAINFTANREFHGGSY